MLKIDASQMLHTYMQIGALFGMLVLLLDAYGKQTVSLPSKPMYVLIVILFVSITSLAWPFLLFESMAKRQKVE